MRNIKIITNRLKSKIKVNIVQNIQKNYSKSEKMLIYFKKILRKIKNKNIQHYTRIKKMRKYNV